MARLLNFAPLLLGISCFHHHCRVSGLRIDLNKIVSGFIQNDLVKVSPARERESSPAYYWPHARGHPGEYSVTKFKGPTDLQAASWEWHHPDGRYHTTVIGGPLIDDLKNIYLASMDGIRKFSQGGKELWHYKPTAPVTTSVSLMDGSVFGNAESGVVYALDMQTGKERWSKKLSKETPGDTGYVESYEGVVVTGLDSAPHGAPAGGAGGAQTMLGLDAQTGDTLWEFKPDAVLWNIMAVFPPGDDSLLVMDVHGAVYKHSLRTQTLLWKADPPPESADSWTDGGVILGPDGTAYTCSNYAKGRGHHGTHGALRAYRLQDGHMLWDRYLEYPCNSWPAVTLDGSAVIVPTGEFVGMPAASDPELLKKYKKTTQEMHDFSLSLKDQELKTYGMPDRTARVMAFNPKTGAPLWSTDLPPFGRLASVGDEEGYLIRKALKIRTACWPAQFGSPTISGDGTIYVGRADGNLYAIEPGTGKFDTFDAGSGFEHPGTSWAPGMMAVASCDGLSVWNYDNNHAHSYGHGLRLAVGLAMAMAVATATRPLHL